MNMCIIIYFVVLFILWKKCILINKDGKKYWMNFLLINIDKVRSLILLREKDIFW